MRALEPPIEEDQRERLHRADENTAWFSRFMSYILNVVVLTGRLRCRYRTAGCPR